MSAFVHAIEQGNIVRCRSLLNKEKCEPIVINQAFQRVLYRNDIPMADFCIQNGLNTKKYGKEWLAYAIKHSDVMMLKWLLGKVEPLILKDTCYMDIAAQYGRADIIQSLIDVNVKIDPSALFLAAESGHKRAVEKLISNVTDFSQVLTTALRNIATKGLIDIVIIITNKCLVNLQFLELTPIHYACIETDLRIIDFYLTGVNQHSKKTVEQVITLIGRGYEIEARHLHSYLMVTAIQHDNIEVLCHLLKSGVNVRENDYLAILFALKKKKYKLCGLLVAKLSHEDIPKVQIVLNRNSATKSLINVFSAISFEQSMRKLRSTNKNKLLATTK
ncbi:MAG: ankyrin repeat domain-containing protein [Endozoicomonadaceae bacterium]|nr:ankyrin repeat domain-containing protein [Endozoicomonadaceae bacterium]